MPVSIENDEVAVLVYRNGDIIRGHEANATPFECADRPEILADNILIPLFSLFAAHGASLDPPRDVGYTTRQHVVEAEQG